MKPKNFPARKLARKIAADVKLGNCAKDVHREDLGKGGALDLARAVRTKKRRG